MSISSTIKQVINVCLSFVGLELITLKKEKDELRRLLNLKSDYFEQQAFPVLQVYKKCNPLEILEEISEQKEVWSEIINEKNGKFSVKNDYFTSPDAEVLSALVRLIQPDKIVEIGSGNSTRLFRIFVDHFKYKTEIISIDPFPRIDVSQYAHTVVRKKLEEFKNETFFCEMKAGDFLFIDSSHEVKTGNDVVELLINILPRLNPGVVIHIHDIFLPYEYPKEWVLQNRWPWNEQYLVQALLQDSESYEVLWAGHYHQRTMPEFGQYFPLWRGKNASSLWLRKKG